MSRFVSLAASLRVLRLLIVLSALALVTCDSLWTPFHGANPNNCVATPDQCPKGLACNPLTKLCEAPPTTLSLVAGGLGVAGDGAGAGASFKTPVNVVADGEGNLYVADYGNHTIRKVVVSTGEVTTIAGLAGMAGSKDGPGAVARFNGPLGLALDGAGALYVGEYFNHTIRKVDVCTGTVTTLAGTEGMTGSADGQGDAARFNGPYGLACDGAGALYVADSGNHTIRRVATRTGEVTTIAGSAGMNGSTSGPGSTARFYKPAGIALDKAGHLYVADSFNYIIRRVDVSTGSVSTVAGGVAMAGSTDGTGPAARFYYPYGIASEGPSTLYVADYSGPTIRKVVVSAGGGNTGVVTTLAGKASMLGSRDGIGASAQFNQPNGLATDGTGNLFVAEEGNHTIRKIVLATGAVSTLAGTAGQPTIPATTGSADGVGAAAQFNSPGGLTFDGADTIYIADTGNHTIRRVVVSTGEVTTLAGAAGAVGNEDGKGANARFRYPADVLADGKGTLFIADRNNHRIRKLMLAGGDVSTLAGSPFGPGAADGRSTDAQFRYPYSLAFDGDDSLYVADSFNHTIRRIKVRTGDVDTLAGTAGVPGTADGTGTAAQFTVPSEIAFAPPDTLYVADTNKHTIRKIQVSTREVSTVSGAAGVAGSADGTGAIPRFNFPSGLAFDGAGSLYIADRGNRTIRKFDLKSDTVSTVVGIPCDAGVQLGMLPGRLNEARDVAVSPTGRLFISEGTENAILRVD